MLKSKKGFIGSTMVDFWSFITFIFIILFFWAFFSIQSNKAKENKIQGAQDSIHPDLEMVNYLRMPTNIDGREMVMADLIVMYYNEKDDSKKKTYYDRILRETKKIFDGIEHCIVPRGTSDQAVIGYAIYILDEESYKDQAKLRQKYEGTAANQHLKFKSGHFFDGLVQDSSLTAIPNALSNNLVYVGLFVSSKNTFRTDVKNVKDCK